MGIKWIASSPANPFKHSLPRATREPIIKAEWLHPGVFYSRVGSHECEFEAIKKSDKRIVDDWDEIKHRGVGSLAIMYHDGLIGDEAIYAELGEVVTGRKPGRESPFETIYFNTVGMGIEDVALASKVYERVLEVGVGRKLRLWERPFAI